MYCMYVHIYSHYWHTCISVHCFSSLLLFSHASLTVAVSYNSSFILSLTSTDIGLLGTSFLPSASSASNLNITLCMLFGWQFYKHRVYTCTYVDAHVCCMHGYKSNSEFKMHIKIHLSKKCEKLMLSHQIMVFKKVVN